MKIAVLGTGNVGGTLGRRWAEAGHDVCFGSRAPESESVQELLRACGDTTRVAFAEDAVRDADVLVLATPWPIVEELIRSLGDLQGKVLIDCINPLNSDFTGLDLGYDRSAAERVAHWAPGAHVVKAFNTVSAATMADPQYGEQAATLFYCGDDDEAKKVVHQLASDLGFEPVDAGPLENARYLEPCAMLYIQLAMRGWGSNCALKILKREKTY